MFIICSIIYAKGADVLIKFSNFIVNHKKLIITFYLLLTIPSFIAMKSTKVNYDLISYLPKNMNSKKGQEILLDEFNISGTSLLMVNNKKNHEIVALKNKLLKIDGIKDIYWLDDFVDISIPEDFISKDVKENFIKGESALLQIMFDEGSNSKKTSDAIGEIYKVIDKGDLLGGEATMVQDLESAATKEGPFYIIIPTLTILIVLSLSMGSIIQPILFLLSIGIAIILNLGTNIFQGEISQMTSSITAALQLGVSMDYSIFLLHRYNEEKLIFDTKEEAMANSITKTFSSISASALTTIAGFAALAIMQFKIGKDMGFVLAKGTLFSLILITTLLPCLILIFDKTIEKYKHKILLPNFNRFSVIFVKYRWISLIIIALLVIPAFLGKNSVQFYYSKESSLPKDSLSVSSNYKIIEKFNKSQAVYMILPKSDRLKEKRLIEKINTIPQVTSIDGLSEQIPITLPDYFIPEELKNTFEGSNHTYFTINLNSSIEDEETLTAIEKIKHFAQEDYDEWYLTGEAALNKDLADISNKDLKKVEKASILLIALILLLTFKSISIPILLILVIEIAIWINLSIPYFTGDSISFMSSIVIGSVQLGATVDYVIFFTNRYKENLENMDFLSAIQKTIKDTGRSILTSALTLLAATIGVSFISSIKTTGELTTLIGRGAIISMMLIFILMPGILIAFEKVIEITTLDWPKKYKAENKMDIRG